MSRKMAPERRRCNSQGALTETSEKSLGKNLTTSLAQSSQGHSLRISACERASRETEGGNLSEEDIYLSTLSEALRAAEKETRKWA